MIEKISWATYATALVLIVLIYYIVIALLYFRKEISALSNGLQKRLLNRAIANQKSSFTDKQTISSPPFNSNAGPAFSKESSDNSNISIEAFDLVEKIKDAILLYSERQYIKEEIITGIQLLLKEYSQLKYSAYTDSINNIIIKECETHCSIRLEDDEVKLLWV